MNTTKPDNSIPDAQKEAITVPSVPPSQLHDTPPTVVQHIAPQHGQQHHRHDASFPEPASKRGVIVWIGAVLFFGALIAMGALPRLHKNKKLLAESTAVTHATGTVNVVLPHYAPGSGQVMLPGSIQAIEETTVNARTSGYLRHRYVDIGSRVKAGQVLADIEAPEVDQQLMQARAETSKSEAGSEQAQADVARLQANVAQAQAELARTQSNLEAARADLAHSRAKQLEAQGALSEAQSKLIQTRKKLNARKSDLDRTRTRYILAEKTWKRWQELAKGGAVSGQELDETQAAYESSQASVAGAQADVESAQADIESAQAAVGSRQGDVAAAQADVAASEQKINAAASAVTSGKSSIMAMQAAVAASRASVHAAAANVAVATAGVNRYAALKGFEHIVAPFNGVITARNVDTGALITAGGTANASTDPSSTVPHSGLFGIARTDVLRIQVNVPQAAVSNIKPGQTARVLVQEFPGRAFMGIVSHTSGALDAGSRTLLTEVRVPNPNNVLIPGMYAQVEFAGKRSSPALRVPANTLIIDGSGTRVATVTKANKLHFHAVQIGRDFGKEAEIIQGLKANERLVENPTDDLQEGMPVRIVTGG